MTATTNSTEFIRSLDPDDPNNVDAILQVTNTDRDAVISAVKNNADTIFTWDYENAHFVFLNQYWDGVSDTGANGDIVPELLDWLVADLEANRRPFTFVFGHEPAVPFFRRGGDSLDAHPTHRDAFWQTLEDHDVTAYICGHTHFYSAHQGDRHGNGDVWQISLAAAGFAGMGGPDMFLEVFVEECVVPIVTSRPIPEALQHVVGENRIG